MNEYQNRPEKAKSNTALVVTLVILSVVAVLVVAAMLTYITITNKQKQEKALEEPPILKITTCPEVVYDENPVVVIDGTMEDKNSVCVLTINGETVETAMEIGVEKSWSKSYELEPGEEKKFEIKLTNQNGRSVKKTKTVYCEPAEEETPSPEPTFSPMPTSELASGFTTPLQSGCEFVKKKSGGLNIREYAGTSYNVVDFINGDDYTSKMVFMGNYKVDMEGYTWYQIISPNGKYGYVRSDLVQRVN